MEAKKCFFNLSIYYVPKDDYQLAFASNIYCFSVAYQNIGKLREYLNIIKHNFSVITIQETWVYRGKPGV